MLRNGEPASSRRTWARLASLNEERFGVRYTVRGVRRLFERLGWAQAWKKRPLPPVPGSLRIDTRDAAVRNSPAMKPKLERRRRWAIAQLTQGYTTTDIARALGISHIAVVQWKKAHEQRGDARLVEAAAAAILSRD
jgi:transposase